ADILTVHQEAATHLHRTLDAIRQRDVRAGVSINPATPALMLGEVLPYLDLVLVMSVNPGFGGQKFIPASVDKVAEVRRMLVEGGHTGVDVEVDGGIDPKTAGDVVNAGASVLVAGAAVYRGAGTVRENIQAIRMAGEGDAGVAERQTRET
ncbi:MAG TPA: ribulose-phosphate 3-epimerase, partial [Longimicrobiales bacterium]|nr:ribulose-phosphate 3-epimerase [Longimicrobiales bacterium]